MSTKLDNLLKQVNAAAREIVGEIQSIDARIESLSEQRQLIGEARVSRSDFMGYIEKNIDRKAGRFGESKAQDVAKHSMAFFSLERGNFLVDFLTSNNAPVVITEEACYWYLKPAIMARMAELANDLDFPDDALSVEKRRLMIADLDAEITKLRAARSELASQLQNAGVVS